MRKRKRLKSKSVTPVAKVREEADRLLTPIIKLIHPLCCLNAAKTCAKITQVAHHHVHKSKSTRLRYEIDNLIPLCNACHLALHQNESYWASKIVQMRGLKWFAKLEKMKNETVKADIIFYKNNLERLKKLYESYVKSNNRQ